MSVTVLSGAMRTQAFMLTSFAWPSKRNWPDNSRPAPARELCRNPRRLGAAKVLGRTGGSFLDPGSNQLGELKTIHGGLLAPRARIPGPQHTRIGAHILNDLV